MLHGTFQKTVLFHIIHLGDTLSFFDSTIRFLSNVAATSWSDFDFKSPPRSELNSVRLDLYGLKITQVLRSTSDQLESNLNANFDRKVSIYTVVYITLVKMQENGLLNKVEKMNMKISALFISCICHLSYLTA